MRKKKIKIFLLVFVTLLSCASTNNQEELVSDIKGLSSRINSVNLSFNDAVDEIHINEDLYIFDEVHNLNKVKLIAYYYSEHFKKKRDLIVEIKNGDKSVINKRFDSNSLDTLNVFYNNYKNSLLAEKFIHNTFNEEEQWNIETALRSLSANDNSFVSTDYFYYIRGAASQQDKDACRRLKVLHLLLIEAKLENFWERGAKRKEATQLTDKYNTLADIIDCEQITSNDSFGQEIKK